VTGIAKRPSIATVRRQRGYILLTLLLFLAVLTIATAIILPSITFEFKRDREEELVHRGVQYSRAIRRFTKKTGRYPMRLEDLQGTNEMRFIRKLYKDPITGRDFKLLHMRDILSGGAAPNLNNHISATDQGSGTSDAVNSPSGTDPEPDAENPPSPTAPPAGAPGTSATPTSSHSAITNDDGGAPIGEPFVGVVSTSKSKSVREFDRKNHYNDWLFFYSATYDRGYEIKGPTSMSLPTTPLQGQAAATNPSGTTSQPAPAGQPQPLQGGFGAQTQ
jgi:type II secretory pathway pseudopilin PulG